MDINKRFKTVIDYALLNRKCSKRELSNQIDINYNTLQNYYRGTRSSIEPSAMQKLYIHLNININWLVTGEGEMFLNEEQKAQDADDILQNLTPEQRQEIITRTQEMQLMNDMKQRLEAVESTLTEITQLKAS